jgi:hypothetical protein
MHSYSRAFAPFVDCVCLVCVQAPELVNPPRMPQCLSSSRVSKALAAAINDQYVGQLQMNASVDTTYIQVRNTGC